MERITIKAVIENIVYRNEDNGYSICEVDSEDEGQFYAVGYMPTISKGETAELTGMWVRHPEYGEQFKVELYNTVMPSDESAMIKYLSSGIIKGVREATAKKLVDKFGKDVFDIIMSEPQRLAEIKGINKERAEIISKSFCEQKSVQNIIMFLQQYSISANMAVKIHKIFGAEAVEKIKRNPYSLAEEIDGISFRIADMIAFNMGLPKNNPTRLRCAIIYFLKEAAYVSGHTYMPKSMLIEHAVYELGVKDIEIESAVSELLAERELFYDNIDHTDVCYFYTFYHDEYYIARRLFSMSHTDRKKMMTSEQAENNIDIFEEEKDIKLAPEQRDAVVTAMTTGCMVLTGGPGTGKTTTINTIIELFEKRKLKIALAAPTGRAAKRMTQITGHEAKTIHRLLCAQMSGEKHMFSHDEENPLNEDVIILDEASMIDTPLMAAFLRAVKPGACVIFSGDSDQLPSVGPGNVLHDIIESNTIPVIKLTRIFRQSEESLIIVNAHKINRGEIPELFDRTRDFFFMRRLNHYTAVETIAELYRDRLPNTYSIDPINDIQVIAPMKKGITGTIELNRTLQKSINPPSRKKREYSYGKTIFREGDKVMQIRNNYDIPYNRVNETGGTGIYNGDIGIIESIHSEDKYMIITFDDDKIVEYPFSNLDELDLAYAITVHKSQGSEFPYVIMAACAFVPMLMSRNLFYTAITRAKKMVILVGSDQTIVKMTKNNSYTKRFTGLRERLCDMKKAMGNIKGEY